jgi:hypothetical protein
VIRQTLLRRLRRTLGSRSINVCGLSPLSEPRDKRVLSTGIVVKMWRQELTLVRVALSTSCWALCTLERRRRPILDRATFSRESSRTREKFKGRWLNLNFREIRLPCTISCLAFTLDKLSTPERQGLGNPLKYAHTFLEHCAFLTTFKRNQLTSDDPGQNGIRTLPQYHPYVVSQSIDSSKGLQNAF